MCSCGICDTLHSPNISQRYCKGCKAWFNETCLTTLRLALKGSPARIRQEYGAIRFDEGFVQLVSKPIRRGGPIGIVGNGLQVVRCNSLLRDARRIGRLPDGWKDTLLPSTLSVEGDVFTHYKCPVCVSSTC